MDKKIIISALLTLSASTYTPLIHATTLVAPKDAYKAVLSLYAYNSQGKLLRKGTAVYVDAKGIAVTSYSLLKDAEHAEVVDAKGKKYAIKRILGANATTDLVKFSIDGVTKNEYFDITTSAAPQGSSLQLLHYTTNKKTLMPSILVESQEPYNDYAYYHISATNDSINFSCPIIDANGYLVAFVQRNVEKNATGACAIDARFVQQLNIKATSAFDADLNALRIPRALPADKAEANSYLDLLARMGQVDSALCVTAFNDFITSYPEMPDGYVYRGSYWANKNELGKANADFELAVEKSMSCKDSTALSPDAVHYTLSNLIYRKVVAAGKDSTFSHNWNLARAEQEADLAYAAKTYTLYLVQKGNCQYANHNYKGAFESFEKACQDKRFVSSETYFSAAKSLEMAKGDNHKVLTLLDSCIAYVPEHASAAYGQYYLERSQRLIQAERYREAVADYNKYEQLIGPRNLNEQFYDLRSQAEEKAHMYQQALDDLHTAIAIAKQPLPYKIDEAALLLNIGEYKRAITSAQEVLKQLPNNADCLKITGVAYGELKQKALALQFLNKAKAAGDKSVDAFIDKYSK